MITCCNEAGVKGDDKMGMKKVLGHFRKFGTKTHFAKSARVF